MNKISPKVFAHCSYIGTTGYNNHTRSFLRALSELIDLKARNFTVTNNFKGHNDTPHDVENYINSQDKKILSRQTYYSAKPGVEFEEHDIYTKFSNNFEHNVDLVFSEMDHHYYYQDYDKFRVGYTVWETTEYPDKFFQSTKNYDQLWVASQWQKDCIVKQGYDEENVKVVPEAVNSKVFYPNDKSTLPEYNDKRFKFILFGRWDYRKSTKEIIEAFLDEFDKNEKVDLVLSIDNVFAKDGFKTTEERLKYYNLVDPRLKIKHFPSRDEYIKYLQKGHVFLSCARSEGWNLPLIEAMACGTPSIYSNCSAQLEFAKGKGHPVKIEKEIKAVGGEYSTYSQSELPGNFYEPDFNDLKKVMRDVYTNYKKYKKKALQESQEIRTKYTWENAAKIAYNELNYLVNNKKPNKPKNKLILNFDEGAKVELIGNKPEEFFVEFIDPNVNKLVHQAYIKNNTWTCTSVQYYVPWLIFINNKLVYNLDLTNQKVKITFDSSSIGDTLAWIPQVVEFQKKHNCELIVSTFFNEWFENLDAYKNIKFIKPNLPIKCLAQYKLGWFKENGKWDNYKIHKNKPNTIPLIQAATDILDLPFKEINYGIDFKPKDRPLKEKYICIGPQATSGLKEWSRDYWIKLADLLTLEGYKVISLSVNGFEGNNIISKQKLPWDELFNYLYHADLFIGLGSGLSWINWALNKHTFMINGFADKNHEFTNNITRIQNLDVCNGCWNKEQYIFDPHNWDWCPENEGTELQHICQKAITPERVYKEVKQYLI
mgnify:FL=1